MERQSCEFLSPAELAERLGVSRRTVFRLVSAGQLPQPIRLSKRTVRFDWWTVQKWLSANQKWLKRAGGGYGN